MTKEQENKIQTLGAIAARMQLAAKMGVQYGGDRKIYEALGYPLNITYQDYEARYYRQDIAKAIINRPVKMTWRGGIEIIESNDEKETALEKGWIELNKELKLVSKFSRLDKLTGLGEFGILFLGLSDAANMEAHSQPVTSKPKLLYVKPFGQGSVNITSYESRSGNPRYGLPKEYTITILDTGVTTKTTDVKVHFSRVIHVTDDMMESEVKGTPRLEAVYNRLMDLEKVVGGDAEMFWRGARPGFQGNVAEDYEMTPEMEEDLQNQIDEYENNLRRILINKGVSYEALSQQIADPKSHVDVLIQMISAETGIPKRILTGSERGELSSTQDRDEMMTYIQSRREEYAEPNIVRPFIDYCIKYGILPAAGADGYTIKWEDLFAASEKEKVEIGKARSEALSKYAASPMTEMVIPPAEFLNYFLGLSKEDVKQINVAREKVVKEEEERQPTPAELELERQEQERNRFRAGGIVQEE